VQYQGCDDIVALHVGEGKRATQVGHLQVRAITEPPPGQLHHPGALVEAGDDGAPVAQRGDQRTGAAVGVRIRRPGGSGYGQGDGLVSARVGALQRLRAAEGSWPGRLPGVCAGELGADLAGVGVLQVLEDGQRRLPGLPGLRQLAGSVDDCLRSKILLALDPAQPVHRGPPLNDEHHGLLVEVRVYDFGYIGVEAVAVGFLSE
jgi:hypothetical protein